MGIGPEDLRVIKEIKGEMQGGRCGIFGDCTFWYGNNSSLEDFKTEMGFDSVETFDINGSPTNKLDLQEKVPENFIGKFDLLIDSGTLYSVFDVSMMFSNIVDMLKVGGMIWHNTNLVGHFGRGYWSVSPSVLYEFYTQNGFEVTRMGYYIKEGGDSWVDFQPGKTYLSNATRSSFEFTEENNTFRNMIPNDCSLMCCAVKKKNISKIKKPVPKHFITTDGK